MNGKNDNTLYFPNDILLQIFSDRELDIQEIIILGMVCNHWYKLTLTNTVWEPLFLKRFSYSPTLVCSFSLFKDGYQKQLTLTQERKNKCKSKHECSAQPGLLEAIREKNIPLIYSLFHSGHLILIDRFPKVQQEFIKSMLDFLSLCSELPSSLLSRIFKRGFGLENGEASTFLPMHFIVIEADEILLNKLCKALGNHLLSVSRYCDLDDKNFFSCLLNYSSIDRFKLVLRILYETLGRSKLSELLVYQNLSTESSDWSCIHSASHWGGEYFSTTLDYLEQRDHPVLIKEGMNKDDIPLFNLARHGDKQDLSHLLNIWGPDAPKFLKFRDSKGRSILSPLLLSEDVPKIELVEEVMGMEFVTLLLMNDENGQDILGQIMSYQIPTVLRLIATVLRLLNEYDCLEFAMELYNSNEFTRLITENPHIKHDDILILFNKYVEEQTNISYFIL